MFWQNDEGSFTLCRIRGTIYDPDFFCEHLNHKWGRSEVHTNGSSSSRPNSGFATACVPQLQLFRNIYLRVLFCGICNEWVDKRGNAQKRAPGCFRHECHDHIVRPAQERQIQELGSTVEGSIPRQKLIPCTDNNL